MNLIDLDLSMRRRRWYLFAAGVLFVLLALIAVYVRDLIVRPYVGDLLVVIFLYLLVRGATGVGRYWTAGAVFILAAIVEYAQMLQLLSWLGLSHMPIVRIVLGSTPDPIDMALYAAGVLIAMLADRRRHWCRSDSRAVRGRDLRRHYRSARLREMPVSRLSLA